jgi:hypothetical protein
MLLEFEIHTRPNYSDKDTVAGEEGDELRDVEVATYTDLCDNMGVASKARPRPFFFLAIVDLIFTVKLHLYIELV